MADAAPKTQIKSPSVSEHETPSKSFLYKAALVIVFLVLVPLFPSLAPDFFNQTLHARSWELLQLIFVGIAVSYGLFSKKNDEPPKDKIDNAQSYVSKLLQVSSVFDDESESQTVIEESKFEALNSQYYRGEPVVKVVANENPTIEEKNGVVSQIISSQSKPLLLPVRSLKQRAPTPNEVDLGCKRFSSTNSRKSRNGDFGRLSVDKTEEEEEEEKVVLRSPIPWRSRSGRLEMKQNGDELSSFNASPSMEEKELSGSFRISPMSLSHSKSDSQSKYSEDVVRKKGFTPPPPAPPPPPTPSFLRNSVLMKTSSSIGGSTNKVMARSVRSMPTEELIGKNTGVAELRCGDQKQDLMNPVPTFRLNASKDYEVKYFDKMWPDVDKKEKDFAKQVLMDASESDSSEESDSEAKAKVMADTGAESNEDERFAGNAEAEDVGPDVDKKADEFIAKFREQIRLQRIECIRRSTAQRAAGKASSR